MTPAGCGGLALPAPVGKWPVGLRQLSFYDDAEQTPLSLTLFYPAQPGSAGPAAPYAFAEALEGWGVMPDTACIQDAPVAKDGPFPLVAYSHGYLTFAMCNSVLCADLASCGYIVAAIGHTGEAWVRLPDGAVLPKEQKYLDYVYEPAALEKAGRLIDQIAQTPRGPEYTEELRRLAQQFYALHDGNLNDRADVWQRRTGDAVRYLQGLSVKEGFLCGALDLSRGVGVTGHSFGGATAANCCAGSDLFCCGVDIDGAQLGGSFGCDVKKPFLTIGAPDTCAALRDLFLRNTADSFLASVAGVEHMGFTDKGMIGRLAGRDYDGIGRKDPFAVREIMTDLHTRFFARYLRGQDVEMAAPDDQDVELRAKYAKKGGETAC